MNSMIDQAVRWGIRFEPAGASAAAGVQPPIAIAPGITASVEIAPDGESDLYVEVNGASATAPAVALKLRDAELAWAPGFAWIQGSLPAAEAVLPGLAEFAWAEGELRRLEAETEAAWPEVHEDRTLAFEVRPADLKRNDLLAARMGRVFDRRIRLARLEPVLLAPSKKLAPAAWKVGEQLREKAEVESRLETLSGHCEVFEHVYEMASQRLGEFRASHQGNRVEWIIVALLAAETLFMLLAALMQRL